MKTEELNKVSFLEADLNYTIFHFENGTREIHAYTLKKFEESFKGISSFFRIHRKYLVNSSYVTKNNGREVILKCGKRLPIARSKRVKRNKTVTAE